LLAFCGYMGVTCLAHITFTKAAMNVALSKFLHQKIFSVITHAGCLTLPFPLFS
jgi:hypothetical protein